jgi:fatty-acyl-CoA synthase
VDISLVVRQPLKSLARFDPARPALRMGTGATLTYTELAARTAKVAGSLRQLGVGPGDRVALLLYNEIEYWLAYFAITRLRATVVRVNFRLSGPEIQYVLADSGSTVLITDTEFLERVASCLTDTPVEQIIVLGSGGSVPQTNLPVTTWATLEQGTPLSGFAESDCRPGDIAMIMYTSGTTGRPKGAIWTHGSTMSYCAIQAVEFGFSAETTMMVTGPLYHVGALENLALPTLMNGGQVVFLASGNFDIGEALRIAVAHRATDLALFPAMIYQWLQQPDLTSLDLTSLKRLITGGDPLLPWAIKTIGERYPWIDIIQVYGLTEGTPIAACNAPGTAGLHPGAVGRPLPLCEIEIRDDDATVVPDGTEGEIWTRSAANSAGYWNNEKATAETFIAGWCRTGDLGLIDDGLLSVSGRKKDMIRSGGENIYAREIEDVLIRHELIADAAVIGVPHEWYGQTVCAVVVPAKGASLSADEVIEHCLGSLARYKRPRHVVFLDELPRTASQKVQKFILREMYATLGSAATTN